MVPVPLWLRRGCISLAATAMLVGPFASAHAEGHPPWPDTPTMRLAALAVIETLDADLLASRSATLTLEKWCGDHKLATTPRISAHLIRDVDKPATAEQRQRLQVSDSEPIKYRHVELWCGSLILSIADNWYVPSRLTPVMNTALETTDTPFGKAVLALQPTRKTFAANILWSPLPAGWDMGAGIPAAGAATGELKFPAALFEHRALLYTKDNVPFSEVDEVYQRDVLAFQPPDF